MLALSKRTQYLIGAGGVLATVARVLVDYLRPSVRYTSTLCSALVAHETFPRQRHGELPCVSCFGDVILLTINPSPLDAGTLWTH